MDISKMRLADETDTHFAVHDGDGVFKVAKKGLSKSIMNKIRRLQPAVAAADGIDVPEGDTEPVQSIPSDAEGLMSVPSMAYTPGVEAAAPFVTEIQPEIVPGAIPMSVPYTPAMPPEPIMSMPPELPAAPAASAAPAAEAPAAPTREELEAYLNSQGLTISPLPAPKAKPAGVSVPKLASTEVSAELTPEEKTTRDEIFAAKERADQAKAAIDTVKAANAQMLAGYLAKNLADNEADFKTMQANEAKADAEFEESRKAATEFRIDPKRYFGNKSTAQKIGTALSLVVGGLGSGLTGRPNAAAAAIDRAIEQDIDAQKSQKDSIFKRFEAAVKDKDAARELTRIKMKEITALHLAQLGAKAESATTAAEATALSAQQAFEVKQSREMYNRAILQDRVNRRQADLSAQTTAAQLQHAQLSTRVMAAQERRAQEQFDLNKKLFDAQASEQRAIAGDKQAIESVLDSMAVQPTPASPVIIRRLPKEYGEKVVSVAPGMYQLADTEDDAKQLKKMMPSLDGVINNVEKLRDYAAAHMGASVGARFSTLSQDYAAMDTYSRNAQLAISQAESLGAYDKGTADLLSEMIPNPAAMTSGFSRNLVARFDAVLASYRALRQRVINQRLIGNQKAVSVDEFMAPQEITPNKAAESRSTKP